MIDHSERPASGALTATGGFLNGFTHTLQPYIGCQFGCEYCYVKGLGVHRFHQPAQAWGTYAHPRTGIAGVLRKELTRLKEKGLLDRIAIFMSSATDPYQGLERRWGLAHACLEALVEMPPALIVIQTRSPLAAADFSLMKQLGERCWLSVTVETDLEDVRRMMTPSTPSLAQRLSLMQAAQDFGLNVQAAVSPCLPFSSVEQFGELLLRCAQRVVVDSFMSGDGLGGKRTERTGTPIIFELNDWPSWRSEQNSQALYEWLMLRIGERAGWSQAGFVALAHQALQKKNSNQSGA